MKFAVILENAGGELERQELEVADEDAVDIAATEVIADWVLAIGDTIRIVELP